ncbi:MAG: hypothetical protein DRQ55_15565 [Planctomycetota bacterium]|nr:MAG: hypothetical protein DRQ55_15565 [Planctomycetota bacterium]
MTHAPSIRDLVVTPVPPADQATGLRAWLRFTVDDLLAVDGVALRIGADGQSYLQWPARGPRDRRRYLVRPPSEEARHAIETAVFAELERLAEGAR